MVWGFPVRLKGMKPDSKPGPVNNIADLSKPMWIGLARKPQAAHPLKTIGSRGWSLQSDGHFRAMKEPRSRPEPSFSPKAHLWAVSR
jgi:hypothetical protein